MRKGKRIKKYINKGVHNLHKETKTKVLSFYGISMRYCVSTPLKEVLLSINRNADNLLKSTIIHYGGTMADLKKKVNDKSFGASLFGTSISYSAYILKYRDYLSKYLYNRTHISYHYIKRKSRYGRIK